MRFLTLFMIIEYAEDPISNLAPKYFLFLEIVLENETKSVRES